MEPVLEWVTLTLPFCFWRAQVSNLWRKRWCLTNKWQCKRVSNYIKSSAIVCVGTLGCQKIICVCVILITFPPTAGKMRLYTSESLFLASYTFSRNLWAFPRSPSRPFLPLFVSSSNSLPLGPLTHTARRVKKSNNVHQPARSGLTFCQTAYHTLLIAQAGHTDSPTAKMLPLTQASCNVRF